MLLLADKPVMTCLLTYLVIYLNKSYKNLIASFELSRMSTAFTLFYYQAKIYVPQTKRSELSVLCIVLLPYIVLNSVLCRMLVAATGPLLIILIKYVYFNGQS